MINVNSPDFERPQVIFQSHSYFAIDSHRFGGKPSFDGHYGGLPLLYDRDKRALALDPSDNHTIVYGATGSKKTRAFVMPAIKILGHAGESMIINDSKGELFSRTAGELKKAGYNIVTINFRDPAVGNSWNPLQIPYRYYLAGDMDKAAEFANDIASTLTLAEVSAKDPFWDYASSDVCFGLILLLMKYCKEHDMPAGAVNIANLMALRRKLYAKGTSAKNSSMWKWASQDELVAASLSGSIMAPNDTMNSILSVFDQKMRSFTIQPTLLDMLANNNIEIDKFGETKTVVYLITPDEKTSYHRLVSLFISQSYQYLIYTAMQQGGRVPNRINYILDEFSSLPAIGSDFPSMIAAARSRNIRFTIVCQSKNQLIRRYHEEASTITANCMNWVFFSSRELDLLRELSELCGQKKDHTPNVSAYDLQRLSKEKNEALVITGRMKPAFVNFLDIDHFPERKYEVIDVETPERIARARLEFTEFDTQTPPLDWKGLMDANPTRPALSESMPPFSALLGGKADEPVSMSMDRSIAPDADFDTDVDLDKPATEVARDIGMLEKKTAVQMEGLMEAIRKRRDEIIISEDA